MAESPLSVREVTQAGDRIMDEVIALYEESFLVRQRVPSRELAEHLGPVRAHGYLRHLMVSEAEGRLRGFASALFFPEIRCGFLMYLAVQPRLRGAGVGSSLLTTVVDACSADAAHEGAHLRGVLLEIERVEDSANLAERGVREARIRFFERHGARILTDTYVQPPAWVGGPEIPLNLMYLPWSEAWPDRSIVPEFYRSAFGYGPEQPAVAAALQGFRVRTG